MSKEDRKENAAKHKANEPSVNEVREDPSQRGKWICVIRFLKCSREAYEVQEPCGKEAAQPGKRPGSYSSATKLEGVSPTPCVVPPGVTMTTTGMAQARANPGVAIEAISMVEIAPVEPRFNTTGLKVEVMSRLEVMTLRLE